MHIMKKILLNMDYEEKILFSCQNGTAAAFAYSQLLTDMKAASMQMERIWTYVKLMPKAPELTPNIPDFREKAKQQLKSEKEKYRSLFIDVHFYFVAWGNIKAMMTVLSRQPEFKKANMVFNSHRKIIEHYTNARNTFEHFDERLPGGKSSNRVKEVRAEGAGSRRILRGVSKDGFYKHSDKQWDIKPSSLKKLTEIVDEFLTNIQESVDLLIERKS